MCVSDFGAEGSCVGKTVGKGEDEVDEVTGSVVVYVDTYILPPEMYVEATVLVVMVAVVVVVLSEAATSSSTATALLWALVDDSAEVVVVALVVALACFSEDCAERVENWAEVALGVVVAVAEDCADSEPSVNVTDVPIGIVSTVDSNQPSACVQMVVVVWIEVTITRGRFDGAGVKVCGSHVVAGRLWGLNQGRGSYVYTGVAT